MTAEPIAQTASGKIRGRVEDNGTISFRGVRYAEDPVGPHYLDTPHPVSPWDDVREALENGAAPPQPTIPGFPAPIGGDGYLNVNVFTPDLGDSRLPVFVWFCVGGFVICNNAWPALNGKNFARDGVVAVAVNHRVGAEGFAVLEGAPDNRGSLDWLASLHWVQENIAVFGGDPGRITIGGCSAGGATCFDLMTMAQARELFHRAITLSGPPASGNRGAALERNERFGHSIEVPMTRQGIARLSPEALVAATAAVADSVHEDPARAQVRQHVGAHPTFIPELPFFRPVIDNDLLSEDPIEALRAGNDPDIDVLIGHDAHEIDGRPFEGLVSSEELQGALGLMGLGRAEIEAYADLHPGWSEAAIFGQAVTDVLLRLWSVRAADARAPHHSGRTYCYEFNFGAASHGMDVPYLWDTLDGARDEVPPGAQPIADELHACAVRFIAEGDPGWPPYDLQHRTTRVFGSNGGVADDPLRAERAIWRGIR
jgi:para-nitrobenzyl esterase